MALFISIILILAGAVLFCRLASALSVPYLAFLGLGGAIIALLPGTPAVVLDPSLALVIFVAPRPDRHEGWAPCFAVGGKVRGEKLR
jgi:monovalent cation/hydrogen antiporter